MAEQINKNDYINHPDRIGGFNYYSLGETTIKQLQQNNLISSKTKYSLQGTTQGRYLTGGVPPVRFSM